MTELIKRFTDADKYFIDGMVNTMCGYYSNNEFDCEPENIPIRVLIEIMDFYIDTISQNIMLYELIQIRWKTQDNKDEIYQDLYDLIFEKYNPLFETLSENIPLPS